MLPQGAHGLPQKISQFCSAVWSATANTYTNKYLYLSEELYQRRQNIRRQGIRNVSEQCVSNNLINVGAKNGGKITTRL